MNQKKKILLGESPTCGQPEKISPKLAPKIEPLRGYLMAQFKRCGRVNCKCASGSQHGPYFYLTRMIGGVRRKRYVRKDQVAVMMVRTEAHRRQMAQYRAERRKSEEILSQFRQESREQRAFIKAVLKGLL